MFSTGRLVKIMAGDIENLIFSEDESTILNLVLDNIINGILIPDNETILINRNIDLSTTNLTIDLSSSQIENLNRFKERYLHDINEELWQSLHSYNSQRYIIDLETKFNLQNYRLVDINDNDRRGNLKRGEHFPLLSFSRIGFNIDRTEAIFEINYYFPLAGSGYIIHLKKENNIWMVFNIVMIWIS
jgi:hypothetical protein